MIKPKHTVKRDIRDTKHLNNHGLDGRLLSHEARGWGQPLMEADGLIVNVSSQSGHRVPSAGGFYAPTKFAVRAITEALRKELRTAGRNVRVGAFSPGFVDTPILGDYLRGNPDREQQLRDAKALLPPAAAASLTVSMINQPPEVETGDILVRARGQAS
jgi:NADP-dependent 3-hydroxy acid dehydrogenase YdfG